MASSIVKSLGNLIDQYLGHPTIIEERDACGVGFLADLCNAPSHKLVIQALDALTCMEHRGACGADCESGDGAGITTQIPWKLFQKSFSGKLTDEKYLQSTAVAMVFLPNRNYSAVQKIMNWILEEEQLKVLGWRKVPVINAVLGKQARISKPEIQQCFVQSSQLYNDSLETHLYLVRKKIEKVIAQASSNWSKKFYICSFSSRIIVYKGMVRSAVLGQFYQDLYHPNYISSFVIYHRRFSTNTMPKWPLAQPMRCIAHNGEINTLLGNLNWMKSRQSILKHKCWGNRIKELLPITNAENSDSANLDAAVELLIATGKTPQEALMILIPEAYQQQPDYQEFPEIAAFYSYYSQVQEPWDGPALITFTNGRIVGATLDRNGLRPARYCITKSNLIIVSSESGVIRIQPNKIKERGRLGPGQMFAVDIKTNTILKNKNIKNTIARKFAYSSLPKICHHILPQQKYLNTFETNNVTMLRWQTLFGYTNEDVELVIDHMASMGKEPTYCMGDDIPLAVLSRNPHVLYDYFKQRFAQVTNPAIDSLRESLVMSLSTQIGPKANLLDPSLNYPQSIQLYSPIINEKELEGLCLTNPLYIKISTSFPFQEGYNGLKKKLAKICYSALQHAEQGIEIIILSDYVTKLSADNAFIPPLLVIGTVHHYLITKGRRQQVSLIAETAQCWSTHHFACLIGYGASAICPYLAFKTVRHWWHDSRTQKLMQNGKMPMNTIQQAQHNYRSAIEAGLLKILSKMGISLLSSYHGAQIFEILGLSAEVVNQAFKGTISRIGGLTLKELTDETLAIHSLAFDNHLTKKLKNYGFVQYRPGAEFHMNNPNMSKILHKAVRSNSSNFYDQYKRIVENRPPTNLRDLLSFISDREPIPIEKVESVSSILSKFCTGGMSLGALSRETHETLAISMNRIGGKSNSGEGGEDPIRFKKIYDVNNQGTSTILPYLKGLRKGDTASSAIKQVASGRFGVTPEYLMNCQQLEIKIAQGAKPGEGGQLPGKKVSPYIAALRKCKPGVTLISPPPHHDIYSIEDLAQLIFDLHQINPHAQVSVKLVAEIGIGTIAAGVAKANADIIQISGHEGGTGASPLSSIKHAGAPWELGLTEVHQTLVANQLRNRVILRVDGGLRTGKDVVLASLMGAEEFGFGTIAMIATGCVMARICHTNNCPVGVASQKQELRKRFPGIPADLVNFFLFIAEEVRTILANAGYKNLKEITGKSELLIEKEQPFVRKTNNLKINNLVQSYEKTSSKDLPNTIIPHTNGVVLDDILLSEISTISEAIQLNRQIDNKQPIFISNTHRSVGTRIAGKVAQKYGNTGFQGKISLSFLGSAGQSFGAFITKGIELSIIGEANDYVGKGMNGGKIVIYPPLNTSYMTSNNVIIGNTCLYGATGGYLFANGQAGERFAVRNSLAKAVVEGVGDHACEYMTGGIIVVLGKAGRNIAAGMTGGIAYFLDECNDLMFRINPGTVRIQRIKTIAGKLQLLDLIQTHKTETKSKKAEHIIDNWSKYQNHFWQLVPPSEENIAETMPSNQAKKSFV